MSILPTCKTCVPFAYKRTLVLTGQKRVSHPPGLKLQKVVSDHVDSGN